MIMSLVESPSMPELCGCPSCGHETSSLMDVDASKDSERPADDVIIVHLTLKCKECDHIFFLDIERGLGVEEDE